MFWERGLPTGWELRLRMLRGCTVGMLGSRILAIYEQGLPTGWASTLIKSRWVLACLRCRSEGGTSIEDLAEKFPDKIIKIPIDIRTGITDEQAMKAGVLFLCFTSQGALPSYTSLLLVFLCKSPACLPMQVSCLPSYASLLLAFP